MSIYDCVGRFWNNSGIPDKNVEHKCLNLFYTIDSFQNVEDLKASKEQARDISAETRTALSIGVRRCVLLHGRKFDSTLLMFRGFA